MIVRYQAASDKVISKRMGDEIIVINLESGIYYCILDSGMAIWDGLMAGASVAEIATALAAAYPDASDLTEEIEGFVGRLSDEDLIAPSDVDKAAPWQAEGPDAYAPAVLEKHEDVSAMVALDPPLPELD